MAEENGKKLKAPKWALALAILIPSISSAGAAWYGLIVGDPEAKEKANTSYNTLSDAYRKLHLMVVHMQGQQEGYNNAKLMQKIEDLEKENDKLRSEEPSTPVKVTATKVKKPKKAARVKNCPPGWVRIEGRCTKSRSKIAQEVEKTRAKLAAEKKARVELEMKKKWLQKKVQVQQAQRPMPAPAPPPSLPESLEEASKKAGK